MTATIDKLASFHDEPWTDAAAVHAEHGAFVWATLQRLGVRENNLDDLYQEVFVVVHRRLPSFDKRAAMPPWLFGICVRVVAAFRRRAHHRREQITDELHTAIEETARSPEDAASLQQSREQLLTILDELDLERRAIFVMFEIDEVPCETIAESLGIPLGTVYSRLHHARKDFQRAVERFRARGKNGAAR